MLKYYEINEDAARRAKQANSYFDYAEGSATASYRREVDKATQIAERQKARVPAEFHGKIDALLDQYARKLADNTNRRYEIDARVPSIMIAGGSNFNVRAKEKQNAARDTNEAEYQEIQSILDRMQSVGMGGIMSDDKDAIAKLTAKLEKMEALQAKMRAANAYYRKHKTLDGCPDLGAVEIETLKAAMKDSILYGDVPFAPYELSNNNANIRRVKERIAQLEKEKQRAAENADAEPIQGDGYRLVENAEIGRIQFLFDSKPDDETRALLKSHGFRWAPSESAWQRMLNDNGRYAAKQIMAALAAQEA